MLTVDQFYLGCLAHASYLVGSGGVGVVIDPQRDIGQYLETARERGLTIRHIIETHLHADFVSGHRELAEATGAQIYLGDGSGAEFDHVPVRDGDEILLEDCKLQFLQTPGHTEESVSIVLNDLEKRPSAPSVVFTGDTLFIGDVGRPDLSKKHTPQELAGMLYDSLHNKILRLPDDVQVYPAHGAGSMCGRNMSEEHSSTIGREKQTNYALRPMGRQAFVEMMTTDLPARPEYFAQDVELNRKGAVALSDLAPLRALKAEEVERLRAASAILLDVRAAREFAAAHVPGSINVGLGGQFATWAAVAVGLDREIVLVGEHQDAVEEARIRLARVGIERVAGYLESGLDGWRRSRLTLAVTAQVSASELSSRMRDDDDLVVVDVRQPAEWRLGHVPGAVHYALTELQHRLRELDPRRVTAVYCKGGYRSSIAASLLESHGWERVVNVTGGFDAWYSAGLAAVVE